MKTKNTLLVLSFLLIISLFLANFLLSSETPKRDNLPDFYVGIDVAYDDTETIKSLIDEVSPYTNLFLLGSTGISENSTKLNELCEYLYERNMYFIIYGEDPTYLHLLEEVQSKWGERFLGLEYEDEPAGIQLDIGRWRPVEEAANYSDAANQFVETWSTWLNLQFIPNDPLPSDFHLFTADYSLYWFDYEAGFDVVMAEFGWNYSSRLNMALCRGAATFQNKDWGAMMTWTYDHPPYLGSGVQLYEYLITAYDGGAKYALVFDTNEDYTGGTLQQEHLDALKQFWQYMQANPRKYIPTNERVAYVLPEDHGYGFRGPNDKIWGLWEAGEFEFDVTMNLSYWMGKYARGLDIIYEDGLASNATYREYIFWNSTA
jgi:hypothetical protein